LLIDYFLIRIKNPESKAYTNELLFDFEIKLWAKKGKKPWKY